MRKLKIRIKEDGSVVSGEVIHGISGEGNATEIEFSVPSEYESFNKFLDISESNGNVSQIALSIKEEKEFSWMIPHNLTEGYGFDAQLVMKKGSEVFKSVLFAVTFEGGINATSYMESEYTDSIELLFETKAEKGEVSGLEKKLNSKLSADTYYFEKEKTEADLDALKESLSSKAEREELEKKLSSEVYYERMEEAEAMLEAVKKRIPTALSQLTNDINAVTDKKYVHTDNNFTNEILSKLNNGVVEKIGSIDSEEELKKYIEPGVFIFELSGYNEAEGLSETNLKYGILVNEIVASVNNVSLAEGETTLTQSIFYPSDMILKSRKATCEREDFWNFEPSDYNWGELLKTYGGIWRKLGEKTVTEADIIEAGEQGLTSFTVPCVELSGYTELSINIQCVVNDDNSELAASVGYALFLLKNAEESLHDETVIVSLQGALEGGGLRTQYSNNIIVNAYFRENIHQYSLTMNTNYNAQCYKVTPTVTLPGYYYKLVDSSVAGRTYGVPCNLEGRNLLLINGRNFKFPPGTAVTVYGR